MFNCGSLKSIILVINDSRAILKLEEMKSDKPGTSTANFKVGDIDVEATFVFGFLEQVSCASCGRPIVPMEGEPHICKPCLEHLSKQPQSFAPGGDETNGKEKKEVRSDESGTELGSTEERSEAETERNGGEPTPPFKGGGPH